ncbi:MAG: lysophospholipid acyltransferase family protein [Anaerovoracaceae bacterium]|jgi:1-acyl-sn-glycerol-3-phosphate acyltransferase
MHGADCGKTEYYRSFDQDFVESRDQEEKLKDGYIWIHRNVIYRAVSAVAYAAASLFAVVYDRCVLRVRVKGRKVLRGTRGKGIFLYGNHTQPFGDVFAPVLYAFPKHIYTIVSTANLGIPVIGKILPMLGALPIPGSIRGMKELRSAVMERIENGSCVVIYPEGHVWPWCSFIRPFSEGAFRFPVICNAPAYSMTTTYQSRGEGKKPRVTVYIDGPFVPDEGVSPKESARRLRDEVSSCMKKRSEASDCSYIRYERAEG